jgi:hypothetical protein
MLVTASKQWIHFFRSLHDETNRTADQPKASRLRFGSETDYVRSLATDIEHAATPYIVQSALRLQEKRGGGRKRTDCMLS